MINAVVEDGAVICDERLTAALEDALTKHFRLLRRITGMERRLAAYHSSFRLEEIDLVLEDGTRLELMFKDVSHPLEKALRVKPAFLVDPQREVDAYRAILVAGGLGTPVCYGTVADAAEGYYWLFIERVAGTRLRELGDFALWELAAEWLTTLHVRYAPEAEELQEQTHLLKYSRDHFAIWIDRAVQLAGDDRHTRSSIEWLARRYDPVIERLSTLPKTLIHGEFYPSNVLVRETASGPTVCPVDWEMAAVGPGLLDLAALASGWTEGEVDRLTRAYYTAANGSLDAVQWLGWASGWQPPPEHVHDWLTSAMTLAEKLKL